MGAAQRRTGLGAVPAGLCPGGLVHHQDEHFVALERPREKAAARAKEGLDIDTSHGGEGNRMRCPALGDPP